MSDKDPILPRSNGKHVTGSDTGAQSNGNSTETYGSHDQPERINMPEETNGAPKKDTKASDKKEDPPKQKKFRNNRYATKKTAGQGLMGVSLITSNTSQLKTTLDDGPESAYYMIILTLLIASLILQVVSGVLLMIIGARESKLEGDCANKNTKKTEKLNDISTFIMFIITMINATLASFTVNTETPLPSSSGIVAALNSTAAGKTGV